MDMSFILAFIGQYPVIHAILVLFGSLVVLATAYVAAFPASDAAAFVKKVEGMPVVGQLLQALMKFSLVQRKE